MSFPVGKIIKTFKSKKGNTVTIRYPKKEDLSDFLAFANGLISENTYVLVADKKITRKEEEKYLLDLLRDMQKGKRIHLIALVNNTFAGNCEVRIGQRRKSHVGTIGISLAKKFRDEGIGSELLKTLIEEAKQLPLRLLELHCMDINSRAIHVYEKIGFKRAGVIPGGLEYQEKDVGEVIMYVPLTSWEEGT